MDILTQIAWPIVALVALGVVVQIVDRLTERNASANDLRDQLNKFANQTDEDQRALATRLDVTDNACVELAKQSIERFQEIDVKLERMAPPPDMQMRTTWKD